MVVEINEKEFDERVSSGKVLVDCYAPWCGPCRMLGPIVEELAKETDNYCFYKLNVDEAEEVAMKYGIMSIPTILVFEDGNLKETSVGFKTKDELKSLIGE